MYLKNIKILVAVVVISGLMMKCRDEHSCHEEMVSILKIVDQKSKVPLNQFYPLAKLPFMDSLLRVPHSTPGQIRFCKYMKANILLELGRENEAIVILEEIVKDANIVESTMMWQTLALAHLRAGERANCNMNHAAASCIVPVQGMGVHQDPEGSQKAVAIYTDLLTKDPHDLESRWVLNLAYMTLGKYPTEVPSAFLIPGMEGDTTFKVRPFTDIAADLKLDVNNMAGGAIIDDFDNDGYLDLITSSMGLMDKMH